MLSCRCHRVIGQSGTAEDREELQAGEPSAPHPTETPQLHGNGETSESEPTEVTKQLRSFVIPPRAESLLFVSGFPLPDSSLSIFDPNTS